MSNAKKKNWSVSFGAYGSTIRLSEREPGGTLYVLWVDNTGKQRKRSLGHRDRKRGKQEALELSQQLASGARTQKAVTPLTLREGVTRAFDPLHGMYGGPSRHVGDTRRAVDRALSILGDDLAWEELTPGRITYLVRILARDSRNGRGARSAELMCIALYTIANWLRQELLIPTSAALPKRAWKAAVRQEWEARTGARVKGGLQSPEGS